MNSTKPKNKELTSQNLLLMTQLEQVNQKLLKSEQLKSNFLSNIKNEINNPMTSSIGLLENLLSIQEESTSRIVRLIYRDMQQLNFQLQNVILAADLEAGQINPSLSLVDLEDLISRSVTSLRRYDKQIKLEMSVAPEAKIVSDETLLESIVVNLLSNAYKFSSNPVTIKIKAHFIEDDLEISIADSGVGIPDYQTSEIFDRFNQLEKGTSKSYEGHGLGLTIVSSLVEILNAELRLERNGEDGTVARLVLPNMKDQSAQLYQEEEFDNDLDELF